MKAIHLALIIIFSSLSSLAQQYDVNKWVELLKDDSKSQYISHYKVYLDITKIDSASKIRAANEIAAACAKGNKHLKLMGRSVKAKIFFYHIRPDDSLYAAQMKDCLNEAIEMDDPYLQAEFGRWYSEMLNSMNQTELAVQYAITSLKQQEYLGYENFAAISIFNMWVGEALLVAGYTNDAINFLHRGLSLAQTDTLVKPFRFMYTYNNLGLAYRKLNEHDSAIYYFEKLQRYCMEKNNPAWQQIGYKNRLPSFVELGMLDSAKVVDARLFEIAKTSKERDDSLIAYEMMGKIATKEKDYPKAISSLLKSAALNNGSNPSLLNRVHETLAACYETMGQPEKAYPYLKLTHGYNDSVSRAKEANNNRYLFIKAEYDKEQLRLRQLTDEKKLAVRNRNIGIAALVLIALVAIVWLNRRRKKAEQRQQQAGKELDLFKEEIIKKNNRIEELLASLEQQQHKQQDAQTMEELSRQIILTEADWQNFKSLFEKTYPSFFKLLRDKAPGITEAEQRMAALIKIQLNTKQIAAMQGIGLDSVHKTRHRLRQRFHTGTTSELETIIAGI
jgi:DNA-binding CsgD family transcriptional regulator/Sec-independent protein translocase protein TatA